jgi:hypothetical protein
MVERKVMKDFDCFFIETLSEYISEKPANTPFGKFLFVQINQNNPDCAADIIATENDPYYCAGSISQELYDGMKKAWVANAS